MPENEQFTAFGDLITTELKMVRDDFKVLDGKLDTKIDKLDTKLDKKISCIVTKVNERITISWFRWIISFIILGIFGVAGAVGFNQVKISKIDTTINNHLMTKDEITELKKDVEKLENLYRLDRALKSTYGGDNANTGTEIKSK